MPGIFYTLWLTFFRSFAPAGNSKCFRWPAALTPVGLYHHKTTAFTLLLIIAIRLQKGERGAAKKLWGSPAEQTKEEMLAYKVEYKPDHLVLLQFVLLVAKNVKWSGGCAVRVPPSVLDRPALSPFLGLLAFYAVKISKYHFPFPCNNCRLLQTIKTCIVRV